jgi:uncharacterized membrane protein YbaN (DUF454 family)
MLGVVLPLVPTVPFILLAAFCFARSSQRLHNYLINHALFGKMITDWRESGAINPKAKRLATVSIVLVLVASLAAKAPQSVIGVQVIVLGLVLLFIWTRPSA